ncbi:MAG: helix-turn-helix transcriptional regulator [Clostridiaceae bacterium]|nr:helix-turn-helix transcriptional regulator [Clostridiaceae bacterium]
MNYYKKIFKINVLICLIYTLVFSSIIAFSYYTFSKNIYERNVATTISRTSQNIDDAIVASKDVPIILASNINVEGYVNETVPDYNNRTQTSAFLSRTVGSLSSYSCNIAITKYSDDHAVTNRSTTQFSYYYKTLGITNSQIEEAMNEFDRTPTYNTEYIFSSTGANQYLTLMVKDNKQYAETGATLYILLTYDIKTLLDIDNSTNMDVAIAIGNKCVYATTPEAKKMTADYIDNIIPSGSKILTFTPNNTQAQESISYYYIVSKSSYYSDVLLKTIITLFVSVFILITGIFFMYKITKRIYQPVDKLISAINNSDKEITNEFDYLSDTIFSLMEENQRSSYTIEKFKIPVKDKFIIDLTLGVLSDDDIKLGTVTYGFNKLSCDFSVTVFDYLNYNALSQSMTRRGMLTIKSSISHIIDNEFKNDDFYKCFELSADNHIVIASVKDIDDFKLRIKRLILSIDASLGIELYASIGKVVSDFNEISESYYDAYALSKKRELSQANILVETTDDFNEHEKEFFSYSFDDEQHLVQSVNSGDYKKIQYALNALIPSDCYISPTQYSHLITLLSTTISRIMYNANLSSDIFGEGVSVYLELKCCDNINSLKTKCLEFLMIIANEFQTQLCGTDFKRSKLLIDFINDNYQSNISLMDLAEFMNMSSSHVSRIFKQQIGSNFKEYLMLFRYLKAKELLQSNPMMKIKDVSAAVGCTNPKMLTRLFKKYSEYSGYDGREIPL